MTFEGVIPDGEYGGGTMIVWERGTWMPKGDIDAAIAKRHLRFSLEGARLRGGWYLIRMRSKPKERKEQWLLVTGREAYSFLDFLSGILKGD